MDGWIELFCCVGGGISGVVGGIVGGVWILKGWKRLES